MSRAAELFREARQADDTTTVGGSGDQSKHPHGAAGSGHGGQFVKNNSGGGSKAKAVTPKAAAKPGAPPQHGVLPPPTTSRTMKLGQSGDDVRNLQYAMGLLGFQVPQDGTFDAHTQAAVAQAQQRLGIKPNGHASASLLRKMQDAVRLSPCVKESVVGSAVRLFQIARFTERFDPAQPRDDHGRWSLFADAIALLRKGGHDKAVAHLHEAQIVAARPKESRHASYRHDVIDAERIRTEADRLDEQHSARLFPGSRMEDPENRRLNRAQAAQRRAELAPLESRIAAHEHFFGTQPPEEDHVGTAQSHVDRLQAPEVDPESPVRQAEIENRVRAAYAAVLDRKANKGTNRWVMLSDLRQEMGDDGTSRSEVDAALTRMAISREPGGAHIIPESNQKALTQAHRDAAVHFGGQNKHLISIDDPSPRPVAAQSHVDALQAVGSGDMRDPTRAQFIADRPAADARAADARKLATEQRAADAKGMSLEEWRASRAPKKTAPKAAARAATPGSERTDSERFGGAGKKALPPSKSASPRAEAVATDPSLTDGEKRTRLKAMGMTPEQVDSLVPTAAKKASPAAAKMARGKAATAPFDAQQARTQLAAAKTHDEALAVLQGMSVAQLREVSPSAVKVSKGKPDAINKVLAYEAPHLYGEGLGASLPTLGLHGAAGEGKTLDLPSSALSRGLAGSPWESDHIAPASAPDLPAIRPAAAPSATALFHQATGDRPTTYHANNALKGADAALKRGDSPADVAAGLREQAAALKREPLGEDGIMDRVGRSASERRDLRNAEAAQLVEVADRLDTMHAPSTPSHSPAGRPLSERQSQVLRDLVGRNGDRMAVEDARHDPELADLQERGLIRRYPLKGTIELTPAGRREMRTSSPAVAKVARAKAAPAKKAASAVPPPTGSALRAMASREEAAAAIAGLTKPQLLALAKERSIPRASSKSMADLRKAIVEATVGYRLDADARGAYRLPY